MRTRSAHPVSRPLPFRSLQELRRHLNFFFQLIYFYHNFRPIAIGTHVAHPPVSDGGDLAARRGRPNQLLKRCGSYATKNASTPEALSPRESRGDMTTASKACFECG